MKSIGKAELFRRLPSVDEIVRTPAVGELTAVSGSAAVTDAARGVLGRMRDEIASGCYCDRAYS